MTPRDALLLSLAALAAVGLIAFLAVGRASGVVKRLLWRVTLLGVAAALVFSGLRFGLFAHATIAFRLVLLTAVLLVVLGNLYAVRFCARCGKMQRNLKERLCTRCGFQLSQHGLTEKPKRAPPPPIRVTPRLPQKRAK